MRRTTIDIGIDLGTTNSTIAVIDGVDARVVPNKNGSTVTPSAVWIDDRGKVRVGDEAKARALESDPDNAHTEFKLYMGSGDDVRFDFARSGRSMLPEELSAEVLKTLKLDFQSNTGEALPIAVITVPAAFENPQTAATRRAAELAGLHNSPLLLEPVAASLAYGFQSEAENVYWFVYDFGGGTFDAAVMRIRDGLIQVHNHNGDNDLGGKRIDWDIVTKILAPRLAEQYDLPDFKQGNPTWRAAMRKLKRLAEQAKIEVCRTRASAEIYHPELCTDASGQTVEVVYDLTPEDVERVSRPHIERSLHLCRKTLEEGELKGTDMERVLMVGGSTLNPWVREAVEEELGVPVEFGIDPVTVVARGAAIFAATQMRPHDPDAEIEGEWSLQVVHSPIGNQPDPDFGARVSGPEGQSPAGYTIELVDQKTGWRSGRATLGAEGTFMTQLFAERSRRHIFEIELCDPTGTRIPVDPPHVTYTIGMVPENPPAPNTIGVAVRGNAVKAYISKGDQLPNSASHDFGTTTSLTAGDPETVVRIPLIEGEHSRATRNHTIGVMTIRGSDVPRDLPIGSDIDVTVRMDTSGLLRMQAYVPSLDQDFEVSFESRMGHASIDELRDEIEDQRDRLLTIRRQATETGAEDAERVVARIVNEQMVEHVEEALERAMSGGGAVIELDRRVRSLAAALDEAEDAAEWPELVERARTSLADTREVVHAYGDMAERDRLELLTGGLDRAIELQDAEMLNGQADELDRLYFVVLDRQPAYHVARFEYLADRRDQMRDSGQADRLVAQGRRAMESNNLDSLRATNRQLVSLLPRNDEIRINISDLEAR